MSDPFVVAAAVLAPVALCLAVLLTATSERDARGLVGGAAAISALAGLAAAVLSAGTSDVARLVAVAGSAAAGGAIVSGLVRVRGGTAGPSVVGGVVAIIVALVATLQLAVAPPVLEQALGAVDLGGALPRLVAPAGVALGFLMVTSASRSEGPPQAATRRLARAVLPVVAVLVGALAVAAGAIASERSADTAPSILVGALVGAFLGAVSWMLVVRIAGRSAHPADPLSGALVGAAAALLVLPALVPVAVAATAVTAGLAGGAMRGSAAPRRGALAGIIVGIAAGGVVVGLLAEGIGFAATGGLGQSTAQVMAVTLVAAPAVGAGAIVGGAARLAARRRMSRAPAELPRNDNSPGEPGL